MDAEYKRMHASINEILAFVEWMADQPCKGNGSGMVCRFNTTDPTWCCPSCRANLLKYGPPEILEDPEKPAS